MINKKSAVRVSVALLPLVLGVTAAHTTLTFFGWVTLSVTVVLDFADTAENVDHCDLRSFGRPLFLFPWHFRRLFLSYLPSYQ